MLTKILLLLLISISTVARAELQVGFYSQSCPAAESIVSSVVREAANADPQTPPVFLRLQFHNCFVDGCDGSILLESTANPEKGALAHAGVRGFDVKDQAKAKIEEDCQGVVSCADIVALAARDAIALANGPSFEVPTGRKDGRVSKADHASDMPDVEDPIKTLKQKFADKGLGEKELVLLTAGAHTIGTTACFFMQKRLYNFHHTGKPDPSINPDFLPKLEKACPKGGDVNERMALDLTTNTTFDGKPFENIKQGFAVLRSDAVLMEDPATRAVVEAYLNQEASIESDFIAATVKMGAIKSGADGEIRRQCSKTN